MSQTEIAQKRAHAKDIYDRTQALLADIAAADPAPFWGGLPELYLQLRATLTHQMVAWPEKFGFEVTPPPAAPE